MGDAEITVEHDLRAVQDGCEVTFTVHVGGSIAEQEAAAIGSALAEGIPGMLRELAALVADPR
jgi:hypothetical protein